MTESTKIWNEIGHCRSHYPLVQRSGMKSDIVGHLGSLYKDMKFVPDVHSTSSCPSEPRLASLAVHHAPEEEAVEQKEEGKEQGFCAISHAAASGSGVLERGRPYISSERWAI